MKKSIFILCILILLVAIAVSSCELPQPSPAEEATATEADSPAATPSRSSATPQSQAPTSEGSSATAPSATPDPSQPTPDSQKTTAEPKEDTTGEFPSIQFEEGASSASVEGDLDSGEIEKYLLQATDSPTVTLEIWSPNGDVYFTISGADDGNVLLDTSDEATSWAGTLDPTQSYVISVIASGGRTSYALDVTIGAKGSAATPLYTDFDPYVLWGDPKVLDSMTGGNITDWAGSDGELPDTENIRFVIEGSHFLVTGKKLGFSTWWFSWISLEDFYIELTVDTHTCSGNDNYGLIIRGPEHGAGLSYGYVVAFSCDGKYQVFRLDGANPFSSEDLISWTESEHILTGSYQRNVIGIQVQGDSFTIFANGHELATVTDSRYTAGRFGLYISPEATINFTYRSVKLAYWDLAE